MKSKDNDKNSRFGAKYDDIRERIIENRREQSFPKTMKRQLIAICSVIVIFSLSIGFTLSWKSMITKNDTSETETQKNKESENIENALEIILPQRITFSGREYQKLFEPYSFTKDRLIGYLIADEAKKEELDDKKLEIVIVSTFFDKENKSIAPIYSIVDDEKLDYICIETSLNDELFIRNK